MNKLLKKLQFKDESCIFVFNKPDEFKPFIEELKDSESIKTAISQDIKNMPLYLYLLRRIRK